jgi:hypothetical protein
VLVAAVLWLRVIMSLVVTEIVVSTSTSIVTAVVVVAT